MIRLEDIQTVHVEASSRCNSYCPMCSRYTGHGDLQPDLVEQDLRPEIFYKLFTKDFVSQLQHVYFSGVYGDPCLNKQLPEFVHYLLDNGCKGVSIDTNGGYRDVDWWASLAHDRLQVNFSLDGTDNETLQKYRIGVVYDKVIANLRAFVQAGGQAQWNFIVFKHNEHQVDHASQLAHEIGAKFRLKVTQKFRGNRDFKIMIKQQFVGVLEPPVNEKYRHNNIGTKEHVPITMFKFNIDNYEKLNNNKINCKSLERKEIYLGSDGTLMPCCYLGTHTHDSPGAWQLNELYDISDFDLKKRTVEEILIKMFDISNKWSDTVKNGNLITCLHTCGSVENTTLYYSNNLNKQSILDQQ